MHLNLRMILLPALLLSLALTGCAFAADEPARPPVEVSDPQAQVDLTLQQLFPGLSSGMFRKAAVTDLTDDAILSAGDIKITDDELQKEIGGAPERIRGQLAEYRFFVLENLAVRQLLAKEARVWASDTGALNTGHEAELIDGYLKHIASDIEVTDEELRQAYEEVKEMLGGASFEQVKTALKAHVENTKQGEAISKHLDSLAGRHGVQISKAWAEKQYEKWITNPVEKARRSGKPTMVTFVTATCQPCQKLAPVRDELKKEYAGKLNVVNVRVDEEQILGASYRVSSVPVLKFFNKNGEESHHNLGFMDKKAIQKQIAELGIE